MLQQIFRIVITNSACRVPNTHTRCQACLHGAPACAMCAQARALGCVPPWACVSRCVLLGALSGYACLGGALLLGICALLGMGCAHLEDARSLVHASRCPRACALQLCFWVAHSQEAQACRGCTRAPRYQMCSSVRYALLIEHSLAHRCAQVCLGLCMPRRCAHASGARALLDMRCIRLESACSLVRASWCPGIYPSAHASLLNALLGTLSKTRASDALV